ncbi:hypothetical protein [Haloarchaeobius sp. HRN-SO-5]|uniref:hypothetical protein n=1 Tax=Haloarchaeobius sp. HRN-SO-5 TaxID=3446118 RepID=UPI003EBA6EB7
MSHVPEVPELFVCADCYVVHAGIHDEAHHFRPPDSCSVCESESFYEMSKYPKHPNK